MGKKKLLTITLVNSNYPPISGITGESAFELVDYLNRFDFKVTVIHSDQPYFGNKSSSSENSKRIQIHSPYKGRLKFLRLLNSFYLSFRMILAAQRTEVDGVIIVMTDPPFNIFWASILLKKRKWFYWSMDLFPYGFAAANLVGKRNIFYRIFRKLIIHNPPQFIISLGEKQYEFLKQEYGLQLPATILPCGITQKQQKKLRMPFWKERKDRIYIGYCGNLGEAHSEEFIKEVIDVFDLNRFILVLSIYGAKSSSVLEYAKNKEGILILPSVPKDELSFIDLHLVTLLPQWDHICVPSKAITAVCSGSCIIFFGSNKNDSMFYLREAAYFFDSNVDWKEQLKYFFANFNEEEFDQKLKWSSHISTNLLKMKAIAFNNILDQILSRK